jgi:hypothetical protein
VTMLVERELTFSERLRRFPRRPGNSPRS